MGKESSVKSRWIAHESVVVVVVEILGDDTRGEERQELKRRSRAQEIGK